MWRHFALLVFLASFCIPATRAETLLVLPFFNASKNPKVDWIGESIAEELRDSLATSGVVVLDRLSLKEASGRLGLRPDVQLTHASILKIAQSLDAERAVYGRFEVIAPSAPGGKDSLRITARILDLAAMKQSPEFGETGAFEDLAAVQDRLAWQVVRSLKPETAPSEQEFQRAHPPVRIDAIENYIRGLLASDKDQKRRFFAQAARLDPRYWQPNIELGKLLWEAEDYRGGAEWFQRVQKTSPRFFEANFFLGLCRFYNGDYTGAQIAFDLVAQSVPLNEVFNNLGAAQSRRDRPEALDNFRKALDGDAADPDYHFNVGYALWKRGEFDEAAKFFRATLDRDPQDGEATTMLGRCLKKTRYRPNDPSLEPLERAKETYNENLYLQLKEALSPKKK
jgi:tetratricopeptide (TPR) repeat protein